jgi:hypothetical protein
MVKDSIILKDTLLYSSYEKDLLSILLKNDYTLHQAQEIIFSIKEYYIRKSEHRLRSVELED